MGRREAKIPEPASALGKLATYLREIKRRRGLTYKQMAALTQVGATTLSRAAGGKDMPTWHVTLAYHQACLGSEDVGELWKEARNEVRPRNTGPRPKRLDLLRNRAEFSVALSHAYYEGEALSVRDVEHRAKVRAKELVPLSRSTAGRFVRGDAVPASKEQLLAFLWACGVPPQTHRQWVAAWSHVQDQYKKEKEEAKKDRETAVFFDYFTARSAAERMREGGFEPLEDYGGAHKPWTSRCRTCLQTVRVRFSLVCTGKAECPACRQLHLLGQITAGPPGE